MTRLLGEVRTLLSGLHINIFGTTGKVREIGLEMPRCVCVGISGYLYVLLSLLGLLKYTKLAYGPQPALLTYTDGDVGCLEELLIRKITSRGRGNLMGNCVLCFSLISLG